MKSTFFLLINLLVFLNESIGQNSLDSLINRYQSARYIANDYGWQDRSLKGLKDQKAAIDSIWEEFMTLAINRDSIQDMITYDLFKVVLEDTKYELDWGASMMPLNSEGGFLANIIYALDGLEINSIYDLRRYISRIDGLPLYFEEHRKQMELGVEAGKVSPKIIVDRCVSLMDYHLEQPLDEMLFAKPMRTIGEVAVNKDSIFQLINDKVIPAYTSFRDYLKEEYRPHAKDQPGIASVNNGQSFYEHKVRFYSTLGMSPDEVFEVGMQEVDRIKQDMLDIITHLEYEGDFSSFLNFLRTDEQFYARTGIELLQRASWICKKIESKLPQYFNTLPRNPYTVAPVPEALAPNYTGGRYHPGSYSSRRAGEYWVNTYNLPSRPLYVLPALSLHEAVPGHHLQGSIAQEIELSNFRRSTYLSAFGEGWALYCEYLGKEMGIYSTPYEDFGRLTYEMWRACRLVVDVGLHYKDWSRQEAIDFMASNTALSMHEVNSEIDRYIGWPGQAISYKIGELTIKQLREECSIKYGEEFHLPTFHNNLINYGAMPLRTLKAIMLEKLDQTEAN